MREGRGRVGLSGLRICERDGNATLLDQQRLKMYRHSASMLVQIAWTWVVSAFWGSLLVWFGGFGD